MIPDTPGELLWLIDRPRRELGQIEDAMAARGWPWCQRLSAWVDDLVVELEDRARW